MSPFFRGENWIHSNSKIYFNSKNVISEIILIQQYIVIIKRYLEFGLKKI